jgi:uncharacterized membrane protein (UPF0182 family)
MTMRRWLMLALGVAAVLLILGRSVAGVYSDYLWYDALGAGALWKMRMGAIVTIRVGSAIAAGLFAFLNLYAVRQSVVQLVFPRRVGNIEISEEVSGKYLLGAAVALSAMLGILLAMPHTDWTTLELARFGRPFGQQDPYINADLGFFVYWLPLENTMWSWALLCVFVVTLTVVLLYALTPSLKWQRGGLYASMYVRRHFTILAGVVLLMLAWSFRLEMYSLLFDGSGPDGAFTYVDHKYGVTGNLLLALVSLGAGLIVMWAGSVGQFRLAAISILGVVIVSLLAREVVPTIAEHAGTDAERAARDQSYIITRAGYTRRAYAVDLIAPLDTAIRFSSMAAALPWVSAWDEPALEHAVDANRAPNDHTAEIAWHGSGTGLVADVLSPPPPGSSQRAPWTVTRVNGTGADERGAPLHAGSDAASDAEDVSIDPPLVFPGASPFVIVSDSLKHTTGVPLENSLTRIANAWSLQSLRIASSELPQPRPTLISRRDIRERVGTLVPFFVQGRGVEPLLVGDSLYWSVDLYSASSTYPLSRHMTLAGDDRSYFRHAAIAIVQASTGDISIVPDSIRDPVADSWVRRLPSIFGTWNGLPRGIRTLLTPAVDGLYAQANAFGRYGSATTSFGPRHLPSVADADTNLVGDDLPIVNPVTGAVAIALPLVDESERVRGLLIATGGVNRVSMWDSLPTPPVLRWPAVLERLRSADSSSSRDATIAHGRVRSVPLKSGIGYLQPTYRWRPQSVPSLNRLAILAGDTVRSVVPGAAPTAPKPGAPPTTASPTSLYNAMRDALKRGDWAAFGRAFDALGRALEGKKMP